MAIVAGLVNALSYQQQLGCIAVRIVATTATHIALLDRVCVWLQRFSTLLLMAIETHLGLCGRRQDKIVFSVADMTICTRDGVVVVATTVPREASITLVAIDTHSVLIGHGRFGVRAKPDHRRTLLATPYAARVIATRTVASLALQLTVAEWRVRVARYAMLAAKQCQQFRVVVTR